MYVVYIKKTIDSRITLVTKKKKYIKNNLEVLNMPNQGFHFKKKKLKVILIFVIKRLITTILSLPNCVTMCYQNINQFTTHFATKNPNFQCYIYIYIFFCCCCCC